MASWGGSDAFDVLFHPRSFPFQDFGCPAQGNAAVEDYNPHVFPKYPWADTYCLPHKQFHENIPISLQLQSRDTQGEYAVARFLDI